jgi:hypothetical protein
LGGNRCVLVNKNEHLRRFKSSPSEGSAPKRQEPNDESKGT